jgi:hypothetical protein
MSQPTRGVVPVDMDSHPSRTAYCFSFKLPFEHPEEFTLVLPAIIIDGRRIEASTVSLHVKNMHITATCF